MTIAYWCVLAAALLPFAFTLVAKTTGEKFTNRRPREWQAQLTGLPARAHAAHLNSFEAFPPFAAAVIIAQQLQAPQATVDGLALAFVALRMLYGILYVADRPSARSVVWFLALACVVALFVVAA
jgi:uncharacterized MAPEG superfamily protein